MQIVMQIGGGEWMSLKNVQLATGSTIDHEEIEDLFDRGVSFISFDAAFEAVDYPLIIRYRQARW